MPTVTRQWVWMQRLHYLAVYHEPGPAQFTMCGITMKGAGHAILLSQAKQIRAVPCRQGCFRGRALPVPKYR